MTHDVSKADELAVEERLRDDWMRIPERGGALGLHLFAVMATLFGRGLPRLILWPVVAYYYLFFGTARRASRQFLQRALEREPLRREVFRHLLTFAQCALDRLFFAMGKVDLFDITTNGEEHLRRAHESGEGGLLLGAHLGSFEAMHGISKAKDFVIHVVVYNANSRFINEVLDRFDPQRSVQIVDLGQDRVQGILKIKEAVDNGDFVALLPDRVGASDRFADVDFLGSPAQIPVGAFILASLLRCPVYLVFGLYEGGNRYDLHCEPFADRIQLPRGPAKVERLRQEAQAYADRIAYFARKSPSNWFNFYDFWSDRER